MSIGVIGAGLAYLSDPAAAEHIAACRLVAALEDWLPAYPGLSLYYPSRRNMPARLRAFIHLVRRQAG